MSKIKLKDILAEAFEDTPTTDKRQTLESVKNFGVVGKSLYNNNNIMEVAQQLADIAEGAHNHVLSETDEWFDKVSVNKNMKSLKGSVVEFQKTAKEAHSLNQRLTGLYEDIGHVLNRYYEIDEALDAVGKEDDDIDNDGDQDDWFDKISVNKNMKTLKSGVMEFQKTAKEAHALNQRLTSLYEDIGHVLNRYYEIDEALTEDKGDMDNDGKDEPDDEEYMDNKDAAIKKAMKATKEGLDKRPVRRLKDIGSVTTGIPMLGDMIKNK